MGLESTTWFHPYQPFLYFDLFLHSFIYFNVFFVGVWLLHRVLLVSAVQYCEAAMRIHISPPLSLPPTLPRHPILLGVTEPWAPAPRAIQKLWLKTVSYIYAVEYDMLRHIWFSMREKDSGRKWKTSWKVVVNLLLAVRLSGRLH